MLQLKKGIRLECLRLPLKKALAVAAEMGADGVEINGRRDLRPNELSRTGVRHLKKMLSDLNLQVAAIHFPTRRGYDEVDDLDRRLEATKSAMAMAYDLGCSVVTNRIGFIAEDAADDRRSTMVQALTDLGNFSQKAGAWLAAQSGFEDPKTLADLIQNLPPMAMGVDFDPGQLIINGFSATEAMESLASSVLHFRARDAVRDLSQGRGLEVQLGRGSVDLPALLGALEEQNYQGYFTIERDEETDAVLVCGQAVEYLDNLFK
ncbi:MAG: sugar phosphate isomerase/epimerase family protein [Planctomycetota bacterium]